MQQNDLIYSEQFNNNLIFLITEKDRKYIYLTTVNLGISYLFELTRSEAKQLGFIKVGKL